MSAVLEARTVPASEPRWWRITLAGALAVYGFFASFSTAGPAIALAAMLILVLLRPQVVWHARPWRDPVVLTGLLLLAWIAGHTLVTSGWTAGTRAAVNRYHELLFLPMLMVLLRDPAHRRLFLRALLAGAVLLALGYWFLRALPGLEEDFLMRRISAGFALSLAAFVALLQARVAARPWAWRAVAALLAATVLFAMEGRTGHLLLLVLAGYAAWEQASGRWRWIALVAVPLLLAVVALGSPSVQSRLGETFEAAEVMQPGVEPSSTGIRRELAVLALDLSRQYGLAGAGYANYASVHEAAARARYAADPQRAHYLAWPWIQSRNPHNEYAMQLVGGGVVALALYLLWLGATARSGLRTASPTGVMLAGSALAFALGSALNSVLMDFVEGHFYLGLLGLLLAERRWPAPAPGEAPQRVLVITTRQIGDVLLTSPLLQATRRRWPAARIDVLGLQGSLGMLQGNADASSLIEVPHRLGARRGMALLRRLWRHYDLALVTDAGDRAHLLGWIAAPRRHGILPAAGGSNWWKRPLLDHVVTAAGDRGSVHAVVEKKGLLAPSATGSGDDVRVAVPPRAALPPELQAALQTGCVVVHAPSMWEYKQWPLAHYEAVVRDLLGEGRQVVLTGSGSARDQACLAPLRRLGTAPQLLDTSGRLDFAQLVTLFGTTACYVGPDTSVSHLAAATGVPVVAVFGPTNPLRWAPWPARGAQPVQFLRHAPRQQVGNVVLLQGAQECVPCGRAGCEDHRDSRSDCLASITPARVLEEVRRVLAGGDAAPGASAPAAGTGHA